ncbi:MAG: o-succinylbenzoate synthase [Alkalinema sp. CAN_BIN05]|nr:o-succinylbenzoate synthase [Alkalinema sp. CAN_BIN05]
MVKFAFQTYARKFVKPFVTAHGEWSVRSGILIAITSDNGVVRLGEIAPLPEFGTETLAEAIAFCKSLGNEFDTLQIPENYSCCRFAFEMAGSPLAPLGKGGPRMLGDSRSINHPKSSLIVPLTKGDLGGSNAGLLPAGAKALDEWQALYLNGTRSFKWKIGVADITSELEVFKQLYEVLPDDARLRLDANAGLNLAQAKQWLDECDCTSKIEYLEQPLGIHEFDLMVQLNQEYKTPIALDESIATYAQLEDCYNRGWRGIFVIKPAIAGAPSQLREFCKNHKLDLVFSSVFETAIGRTHGLQLAQELAQELGTGRALGYGTDRFFDQTIGQPVGILESDAGTFLVKFWKAIVENRSLFLGNPLWGRSELDQFEVSIQLNTANESYIHIPTGGTSGKLKFAIHTWETLSESVYGMQQHFNVNQINSFCTLPLHHVSGLMQYLRSYLTNGQFISWDWKQLEQGNFPDIELESFFISLVPTQLQRLINQPKLKQFKTILLGGAPSWESLLTIARQKGLPIALTYGMTETASQVTTLLPSEFLAGQTNVGKPLPHVKIQILNDRNEICPPNEIGQIQIQSKSQMVGVLNIRPDDLGYLDPNGHLHIIGRSTDKIITGGENVYPSAVEALILSTGLVQDICVIGLPDEIWGQRVVAVWVEPPPESPIMPSILSTSCPPLTKGGWG